MTRVHPDPLRLLFIQAFSMPPDADYSMRKPGATREESMMNYGLIAPLLEGVEWEVHPGPVSHHGTSLVETREEFLAIAAARLPVVREACESGRYDAIVLLGGGDPGFLESCEIGQRFGIPVTACGNAQMHVAAMLGRRFSVIDVSEPHSVHYGNIIRSYGFAENCASLRNLERPLPRGDHAGTSIAVEKSRVDAGKTSDLLLAAVNEAEAAIVEDGAESLIIGCSALYWLKPHLQQTLSDRGWDIPVLEGYSCAIELGKLKVRLGVTVSGVAFPQAPAPRFRRVKKA
ncbi:hydrogenase expression protein HupH (plasmid) [Antarctobacter heliothermus]|uniref:Hydrogenase expression protein HupH n=1 Tax=Antarctobacter heliothermus TaxID=74033 RepID=A0A222EBT4_9RHOB|nr:aspartate/glutamate racemase family protein [Antarctobacter heliothermus]ASP23560.1 hydrogenase expression protein HupH [Antarctobacter heliothermus]